MNNSINLVSPKNEQIDKEQNRLKIARVLALVVMFSVAIVAILVFVINLTLPITSIKQNEQSTLANIASLHTKLVQYSLVQDRANHLANIIAKREKLPATVNTLLAVIPSDLSVGTMQFTMQKVSLIISGGSLISMNKLIDAITVLGKSNNILKNIVVQQLSLDVKSGQYSVSIQADVK
jgi:hypothetical protein